jgi:hypothetical protein
MPLPSSLTEVNSKATLGSMDTKWAIAQLDAFLTISQPESENSMYLPVSIHPRNEIIAQRAVIVTILREVHPKWQIEETQSRYEFGQLRDAVIQARSLLDRDEEIREMMKPEGPILSLRSMHRVIWEPASFLWGDTHYRPAVQAASSALDKFFQDFVDRRDIGGRDLVNQSFSKDPPSPGKSRVRVPDQGNDKTTQSLQEGMRNLGEACFAIVRNLSSHQNIDISEQDGLEQLAMLSLFARILETCTLELADEP